MSRHPHPGADDQATAGALRNVLTGAGNFDRGTWSRLAKDGWFNLLVDDQRPVAELILDHLSTLEEWGASLVSGPTCLTVAWTTPLFANRSGGPFGDEIADGRVVTVARNHRAAWPSPDRERFAYRRAARPVRSLRPSAMAPRRRPRRDRRRVGER